MTDKRTSKLDIRSMPGILLRGKNQYEHGSPNPVGKNQHKVIQEAARKRIRGYYKSNNSN